MMLCARRFCNKHGFVLGWGVISLLMRNHFFLMEAEWFLVLCYPCDDCCRGNLWVSLWVNVCDRVSEERSQPCSVFWSTILREVVAVSICPSGQEGTSFPMPCITGLTRDDLWVKGNGRFLLKFVFIYE